MTMNRAALIWFCSVLIVGVIGDGSYVITAPQSIQPGAHYDISVDILNTTGVFLVATVRDQTYNGVTNRYDYKNIMNASGTFGNDSIGALSLEIASDFRCASCQVHFRGTGNLQFEQVLPVTVNYQTAVILVQTDKVIYKPGQLVRYRVFAIFQDLKLYNGAFTYEIKDPNNNKIKVQKNVTSPSSVVEGSLKLSDQPVFGTWDIDVTLEDVTEHYTQSFQVSEYTLPKFQVTVELPPFALVSDDLLTGKVTAKYTFGQPVTGFVELHVGPNQGPNSCGDQPRTTQISFAINGEATFSIPKEDISRAVTVYNGQEVKVTAFVKEDTTGVRLNGSSVVTWYSNKFQVKFTDNTPNVFKPGLPYTAFVQVTTPDNKPPTDNITISIYTSISYQLTVDDQSLYDVGQFSGTFPLPGKNVTLPASGLLSVDIDIPKNATSITVKASVKDVQSSKTIDKMFSESNNFIQLSVLDKNIKSGSTVAFKVDGTEPLNEVTYEVLSRGSIAASGTLNGEGKTSFNFALAVASEFAPTAHLLVYYPRGTKEIVADSLAFNVEGIFKNDVTISFSKNESEPGKNAQLDVTAEPDSEVHVVVLDQSVLLVKTGNDITPKKVNEAVSKFDKGEKPSGSEFALSYSAASVQEVFTKTGLAIVTDVPLPSPPSRYAAYESDFSGSASFPPPSFKLQSMSFAQAGNAMLDNSRPLQEVERIRKEFPETWLWTNVTSGDNGTASIISQVPDTITSWVANAFATHPVAGLGVAAHTASLRVFRPFFVSLTLPSSVIRGEQIVIQAVVFNYLSSNVAVTVTLKGSSTFQSVKPSRNGLEVLESGDQVQQIKEVEAGKQEVVYFPILASQVGVIDIEISAQSSVAADAESRKIIVQSEGAPVSFNNPVFINLGQNGNFQDSIQFPLPDYTVNGSDRARIKVTGDLLSSSLDNLHELLKLPTGCGEQSLSSLAVNVFVAEYLKSTGQLTSALKKEIKDYLETGYQRQLTYQRYDGSFSPFGNIDESGSTRLTAYVTDVLSRSKKFIYLDPRTLVRAVDWLAERQNKDGSFNEFGKVFDSNTQGTGTGPALTAFVLLTFQQNKPLATIDCSESQECVRAYRWGNATVNAVRNLEGLVDNDSIKDQFSLSLVSYALTLANSSKADVAFKKLETFSRKEGGLLFWSDNSTVSANQGSSFTIWRPPRIQSRPINILITSYAILTYTALGRIEEAFPAVRWLTTQRNSLGGFVSTQDTSLALQAISAFASKFIRPDTNINVKVSSGENILAEFHVEKENALVLQIKELNSVPPKIDIAAAGTGFALAEVSLSFNVNKDLSTNSFDVSTVLLDDELDSFNLMICTKWLWNRDSGMVVQEISIPSGFEPDLDTLSNIAGLKRSERKGKTLNVYFDQISKTSLCYSVSMTRTEKIARTQENFVITRSYYNPSDQSTNFWQPKKISSSSICDVCDACCP